MYENIACRVYITSADNVVRGNGRVYIMLLCTVLHSYNSYMRRLHFRMISGLGIVLYCCLFYSDLQVISFFERYCSLVTKVNGARCIALVQLVQIKTTEMKHDARMLTIINKISLDFLAEEI